MAKPDEAGVLIVEDSLVTQRFLVELIAQAEGLRVVGVARDGQEALELARALKPDVISMDIAMPKMGGLEATRLIMRDSPTPIVVVSGSLNTQDVDMAFEALQAGAVAVVEKPPGPQHPDFDRKRQEMLTALRLMARAEAVRQRRLAVDVAVAAQVAPQVAPPEARPTPPRRPLVEVVALCASAGGPAALARVLGGLPRDFPVPVLVVQHLATDFLPGLARWLDQETPLTVRLARAGDALRSGVVYVAPGGAHMALNGKGRVRLIAERGEHRHQPSATVLLESVAQHYGKAAIGVIMTGMGDDGARGLLALRKAGAHTLAQDEASCVVFGMPAAAIQCGAAERVVPLNRMAAAIQDLL
ncbi:MAG: chemotaxis response regulator protein-glutamate methylesterase [Anaerolineae bacterium]